MDLWSIGGGGGSSASRSAKFSVVVFKASLLKWGGSICHRSMQHHYTFPCQSTIDPCYTITSHKSAQGICALCYMWNLCGAVVFHGSIVNWRRDGVSLSWNWFGVVVFHGSMVDWRRGQGQSVMKYIQCNGLPDIHSQLGGPLADLPRWV